MTGILKYRDPDTGQYLPVPVGAGGGSEEVWVGPDVPFQEEELWVDMANGEPVYDWSVADNRYLRGGARNVIHNGDMSIAQRGNGPFGGNQVTLDGWINSGATIGTATVNRITTEGVNWLRYVTTGQSGNNNACVSIINEDITILAGKTATVSFDAYAAAGAPKVRVEVWQVFGGGGSAGNSVIAGYVTLSTTRARYSLTFTMPSIAGKTIGTTPYVRVFLYTSVGADPNIGAQNNSIFFTDVQLEEGPTATPFERLPIQQQLAWCQRYFCRFNQASSSTRVAFGSASDANSWSGIKPLPMAMRTIPTMSTNSTFVMSDGASVPRTGVTPVGFGVTQEGGNPSTYALQVIAGGGGTGSMTAMRPYFLEWGGGSGGYIDFSAEI